MKPPGLNQVTQRAGDYPRAKAQFDSDCPECGDAIYEGDDIVLVDGVWVCYEWCGS